MSKSLNDKFLEVCKYNIIRNLMGL